VQELPCQWSLLLLKSSCSDSTRRTPGGTARLGHCRLYIVARALALFQHARVLCVSNVTRSAPCSSRRCTCSRHSEDRLWVIKTGIAKGVSGTIFLALSHDAQVRDVKKKERVRRKTPTMLRAPHVQPPPPPRGVRRSRTAHPQKLHSARGCHSPHRALQ
jgi:hypothetical protein